MTRLVHRLLSRFGPLVPKWERDEAWIVARQWHRENVRLRADLAFAYECNARLACELAGKDFELNNLKKAGE